MVFSEILYISRIDQSYKNTNIKLEIEIILIYVVATVIWKDDATEYQEGWDL